jgi:CheY-like chemotaxis protein
MDSDLESTSGASGNSAPAIESSPKESRPAIGHRQSASGGFSQAAIAAASPRQAQRSGSIKTPSRRTSREVAADRRSSKDTVVGDAPAYRQLRVLVVEDDAINSQILQKRLKMDKHKTHAVPNGQEAVDVLDSDWEFDAVLMDIQ